MPTYTMRLLLTLLFFLFQCLGTAVASKRCYFPNGKEGSDNHPCDPDAEDSVCCGGSPGSLCLSNKLCSNNDSITVRGSCTDPEWESDACPKFCMDATLGGTDLIFCPKISGTSYCCDHNPGCCSSGDGRFDVMPEKPEVWATWNVKSSRFMVVGTVFSEQTATSSSIPVTSSEPPTSTSTSTSTTSLPTSTSKSSSNSASTSTSLTSTQPSNSADPSGDSTGSSKKDPSDPETGTTANTHGGLSPGAIGGIAAGVAISFILFIAAAFLFWRSRRKNSSSQAVDSKGDSAKLYPQYYNEIPQYPQYPQELHNRPIYQAPEAPTELPSRH